MVAGTLGLAFKVTVPVPQREAGNTFAGGRMAVNSSAPISGVDWFLGSPSLSSVTETGV